MSKPSKNLFRPLRPLGGAAAAVLSASGALHGQAASSSPRRDTTITQRVILLPGRMDSIAVIAGRIVQERPGNTTWIMLGSRLDTLIAKSVDRRFVMGGMGAPLAMKFRGQTVGRGWLGINTQGPSLIMSDSSGTRYRFFAYQPIISVDLGSPAEHAGIVPGDLLVAYNGVDLINHDFNFNEILVPRKRVDITVRRDGETKDFALVAAAVPEDVARRRVEMDRVANIELKAGLPMRAPFGGDGDDPIDIGAVRVPMPRPAGFGQAVRSMAVAPKMFFLSSNGLFGANLSSVSDELARVLKLRKGVLVNDVPEDTPAYRAGLRVGDVIVTADNDSVITVGGLRDAVSRHLSDRSVDLQVVRQQKVRKVTVSWPELP
jgi:S1-C subfamily serine protease